MPSKRNAPSDFGSKPSKRLAPDSEIDEPSLYPTSEASSNALEFQALIGALQNKFVKKSNEQNNKFEAEMKLIVNKTVEVLSERVDQYEAQMYQPNWMDCVWTSLFRKAQMESLKKELQEISRNREEQVSKFKESYESLRGSMSGLLKEIQRSDREYSERFNEFFKYMHQLKEQQGQTKETIESIVTEKKQEMSTFTKNRYPRSSGSHKRGHK